MISPGQHVVDYVDDFLHGSLDAAAADYVEFHCAECKICRVAMDEAEQRHAALKSIPPVEASEELVQTTIERVEGHSASRAQVNLPAMPPSSAISTAEPAHDAGRPLAIIAKATKMAEGDTRSRTGPTM